MRRSLLFSCFARARGARLARGGGGGRKGARAGALTLGLWLLAWSGSAAAKTRLEVPYPFEMVWPSALRYLRIDRGWKLIEQDKEAGFIRFELVAEKKRHVATLELIRRTDEERPGTLLQLSTPELPRFVESPVLDLLERKLREEQGPPPPKKRKEKEPERTPAKPASPPDAGAGPEEEPPIGPPVFRNTP